MKADPRFLVQGTEFWAYVRVVTRILDAADRKTGAVKYYSMADIFHALQTNDYPTGVLGAVNRPSVFAVSLFEYFRYRADVLNSQVEKDLMDVEEASEAFASLKASIGVDVGVPVYTRSKGVDVHSAQKFVVNGVEVVVAMNKQKNDMRNLQYFTGMIDLVVADTLRRPFDYDPHGLATFYDRHKLYGAFARRMDGAYPSIRNARALWEIKEYYYTTTFGSKISDAVYITQLDGYEKRDLARVSDAPEVYLMVDSHRTWWGKGKAYLCRLIDILNMGNIDGVFFGKEVLTELPGIAEKWLI